MLHPFLVVLLHNVPFMFFRMVPYPLFSIHFSKLLNYSAAPAILNSLNNQPKFNRKTKNSQEENRKSS